MSHLHAESSPDPTPNEFSPRVAQQRFATICEEMGKTLIGQVATVERLLLTILCREHALLVGTSGAGKWQAIQILGQCLGLTCRRLRCSSDLSVDDLSGRDALYQAFCSSLLMVDNIDCLAPKLHHLLQQAMCERAIARGNERLQVPDPFVVFATRLRPDESPNQEPPTYAPVDDRFLFQITVPYPAYAEEFMVATVLSRLASPPPVEQVVSLAELEAWRSFVLTTAAPPNVVHFAVRLVRATRVHEGENPDFIYEWVQHGAGPRAAHFLVLAAKARATLYGRTTASHADVRAVAEPVLRHRITTNRNARANGIDADRVIQRLLEEVPARIAGDESIPTSASGFTYHDWVPLEGTDP